jgi:hypothetical protein
VDLDSIPHYANKKEKVEAVNFFETSTSHKAEFFICEEG